MEEKTRKTKLQKRLNDLIRKLINKQNFSEQNLENLNLNFSFLEKEVTKSLSEYKDSYHDESFDFSSRIKFELKVSEVINIDTRLSNFKTVHKNKFSTFNNEITDSNYSGIFDVLSPGIYKAMFLKVQKPVTYNYCINFLKAQNCILGGVQALTLVWSTYKFVFIQNGRYFSLSEKDSLWKDDNNIPRIPYVEKNQQTGWVWDAEDADEVFAEGDWILCIFPN